MKSSHRGIGFIVLAFLLGIFGQSSAKNDNAKSLKQVPFNKVELNDNFWLPRLKIQKEVLVPFSLNKMEYSIENLRSVAAHLRGEEVTRKFVGRNYSSSDLFKVMEGIAYILMIEKDAALEAKMDEIIDIIAASQKPDGYLYEHHILPEHLRNTRNNGDSGKLPYSNVKSSHELYNLGHMYEAAIAYYQATGKRKWLDVAEKHAQHINKVFFEGDANYNGGKPVMQSPGHQEIELALVKMYHATGKKLYLNMAERFINIRGKNGGSYRIQEHKPVREQHEAVGHAVRATYQYASMADIVAATGDVTMMPTLEAIWHDLVDRKMQIIGGLGTVPAIEGFGPAYSLPNRDTYNETCAAIGNLFFNYRMFLMSANAKYVDVAEIALYNNILAGVNLKGDKFFYVNPLQNNKHKAFNQGNGGRSPWFSTACCPSNLARLIPQIPGMVHSTIDNNIYCSFYAGTSTEVTLKGGVVKLCQTTDYPFDGKISITVEPKAKSEKFTLWVRIPSWVNDKFVPGELYSYADGKQMQYSLAVNGEKITTQAVNGFVPIERKWRKGDKVELNLPMEVRYSKAIEKVEADRNRICITRGPIVFCAEEVDNAHDVATYFIPDSNMGVTSMGSFSSGVMSNIPYIKQQCSALVNDEAVASTLTLVPYYAWNNRGDYAAMNTWFARDKATAISCKDKVAKNIETVKASYARKGDDAYAVIDGVYPKSSSDKSILRWTSYRQEGKVQAIEIRLKKRQPIESISVYWFEDNRAIRRPKSWSAEYLLNGKWYEYKPYLTDQFGTAINQFNMVHPAEPIEAEAIRLTIVPQERYAVGILEAIVE